MNLPWAEEIERLRAENEKLKNENERLHNDDPKSSIERMLIENFGEHVHGEIKFSSNPIFDLLAMYAYEIIKEYEIPNFVTWTRHTPEFPVAITFQRVGGKTPEQRVAELENEKEQIELKFKRIMGLKIDDLPELCRGWFPGDTLETYLGMAVTPPDPDPDREE